MDWILENYEPIAAIAAAIAALVTVAVKIHAVRTKKQDSAARELPSPIVNVTTNVPVSMTQVQNGNHLGKNGPAVHSGGNSDPKDLLKIMFVDDDTSFAVVRILRKAGWRQTSIVKDLSSLDGFDVESIDVFFVDIKGVGIALGFADHGLGLAAALKKKYPNKGVILYSAETQGLRFHEAFRLVDDQLPKTAEPYEFLRVVERFSQSKRAEK